MKHGYGCSTWMTLVLGLALAGCSSSPGPALPGVVSDSTDVPSFVRLADHLSASGQPTQEGIRMISRLGYDTVVNLRADDEGWPREVPEWVRQAGLRYMHVPMGREPVTDELVRKFEAAVFGPQSGNVLAFCSTGNRVKALWAIHLATSGGMTAGQAIAEAERLGLVGSRRDQALEYLKQALKP